jgi:hypothetical protein
VHVPSQPGSTVPSPIARGRWKICRKYPPLGFRLRGTMTHPPNAKTPESNDCLNVFFYEAPHGSDRWNVKLGRSL